jgi:hypothetical protein
LHRLPRQRATREAGESADVWRANNCAINCTAWTSKRIVARAVLASDNLSLSDPRTGRIRTSRGTATAQFDDSRCTSSVRLDNGLGVGCSRCLDLRWSGQNSDVSAPVLDVGVQEQRGRPWTPVRRPQDRRTRKFAWGPNSRQLKGRNRPIMAIQPSRGERQLLDHKAAIQCRNQLGR